MQDVTPLTQRMMFNVRTENARFLREIERKGQSADAEINRALDQLRGLYEIQHPTAVPPTPAAGDRSATATVVRTTCRGQSLTVQRHFKGGRSRLRFFFQRAAGDETEFNIELPNDSCDGLLRLTKGVLGLIGFEFGPAFRRLYS